MARIIVSAGHTNDQPGTVVNGIREVDLNRKIASEVVKGLRKADVVTLSVPPNLELAKRIAWINQTGYTEEDGDIAIEIHINEGGKSGIEGWHQADKTNSIDLTNSITEEVKSELGWTIQGVKSEYEHELGSLAFLHNTNPIASLLECGYMDNENDLKVLKDAEGIKKLAKAIIKGILGHLGKANDSTDKNTAQSNNNDPKSEDKEKDEEDEKDKPDSSTQPQNQTGSNTDASPVSAAAGQTQTHNNQPSNQFAPQQTTPQPIGGGYSPASAPTPTGSFNSPGLGGGTNTGAGGPRGGYMNREERKEMIKSNYIKILGREPSQSDLNYFLNLGTNEDQLIKRMVDSQEHADLVKARQEVIKIKETLAKQTRDLLYLRTKVNDQQGIIKNLNQLLIQKNRAIYRLNLALRGYRNRKGPEQPKPKKVKYKRTTSEKFLDFFSDKLGS